jgi:hypothetical protein
MSSRRLHPCLAACLLACAIPVSASAQTVAPGGGTTAPTGGASPVDPNLAPPGKAQIVNGLAVPPADAPPQVVAAINAANSIATKSYKYGGGHKQGFVDTAYDCSGSVSYALGTLGAGFLTEPLDSSSFMKWGEAGPGRWITVWTNPGHAYVMIAGLRFDTSAAGTSRRSRFRTRVPKAPLVAPGSGPRWRGARSNASFTARHPLGF